MSEIITVTTPIPGHNSPYTGNQIDTILKQLENILHDAPEDVTLKSLYDGMSANSLAIAAIDPKLDDKVSKQGDVIEGTLFITNELIVPLINGSGDRNFIEATVKDAADFNSYFKSSRNLYQLETQETTTTIVKYVPVNENEGFKEGTKYFVQVDKALPLKIDTLNLGTTFGSKGATKIQNDKVYGAIWNDYAEYRQSYELEPGRAIIECGDGSLQRASARLQPGAEIVSDTFGFAIGQNEKCKTPIAIAGRVLAYPNEKYYKYKPGDPVCSGPNGTVSKMTRREVRKYPDRIIGTVSEIPTYDTWGEHNIPVNGRIWIRIR